MTGMSFPGANKMMDRMFRKADGVVWDMMTGKIGIKTDAGIATLDESGVVNINMFDDFGVALPAFAQSTPVDQISAGDIIYTGKRDTVRFVLSTIDAPKPAAKTTKAAAAKAAAAVEPATVKKFRTIDLNGSESTWTPPKTTMLGFDSGVMVLRSLLSILPGGSTDLGGMQNMFGMMMQMQLMNGGNGELDMERIMPMMLMSMTMQNGNGGNANPMGNMMNAMMMANMFSGGKGNGNTIFGGGSGPFSRG